MTILEPVRIDGIRDLQAALKAIDGESQKQLRVVFNAAGAIVVHAAQAKVPVVTGKAKASVRATSSQREARVSFGSARVPYAGWLEYGGRVGHGRVGKGTGRQLRTYMPGGRYVYPSYFAHRPEVTEALQAGLDALIAAAGLEAT